MLKLLKVLCVFFVMASCLAHAADGIKPKGGWKTVQVESHATIYDGAKNTARKHARTAAVQYALEEAIGPLVGITSRVRESNLVSTLADKIFSQATGIVKDFKITREWVEDGTLYISAACRVSEVALDGVLGPVMIDTLGNPRIMILIDERIGDKPSFSSITESETLKVFEKAGYAIVKPPSTASDISAARKSRDMNFLKEIAKKYGADVLVRGEAYASSFARQKIEGIDIYGVNSRVQLTAVLSNTGYNLGSDSVEKKTKGISAEDGAVKGFRAASPAAARNIVYKIAYALASGLEGAIPGRTVNVKITGVSSRNAQDINVLLQEADGVTSVYFRGYSDRTVTLDVISDKPAEEVAALLSDNGVEVDTIAFDIVEGHWISED
ncbi:MAG: hypothetical protein LBS53_09005 [Synergistaceae bacterium]|jgi:hypothetical protein|nr:hypothetical protein [Synergistaceae bacterium]